MNAESLILAIVAVLCSVLLGLFVYLLIKLSEFEKQLLTGPDTNSQLSAENKEIRIFCGLDGQALWDAWVQFVNGSSDQYPTLGSDKNVFLALLRQHVKDLISEGVSDGSSGKAQSQPQNPRVTSILRGDFQSYLPPSTADRIYQLAYDIGYTDEHRNDKIASLRSCIINLCQSTQFNPADFEACLPAGRSDS